VCPFTTGGHSHLTTCSLVVASTGSGRVPIIQKAAAPKSFIVIHLAVCFKFLEPLRTNSRMSVPMLRSALYIDGDVLSCGIRHSIFLTPD
jgi:hypothetical protein